ncbi:MAG: T9SS type A sorting domain-containing protein [Bacteroidota bacterium]
MKSIVFKYLLLFCLLLRLSICPAQDTTSICNFFEEKEGLLVIEMEDLPLSESWEINDTIDGYTGNGYIQWTGNEYFNQTGNGVIRFDIKINTPGTYNFNWRVAVGSGEESTLHNDTWLKINAGNFYAKKGILFSSTTKPKPDCQSDANYACPNGSSTQGFFKVFGGAVERFVWRAQTSDHDAHDIVASFDTAGVYSIEINARSSFHCIDRMILWHNSDVKKVNAEKLFNANSTCLTGLITSTEDQVVEPDFKIYPNPARDQFKIEFSVFGEKEITLKDFSGRPVRVYKINETELYIQVGTLPRGMYFLEVRRGSKQILKKITIQ